LEYTYSRWCEKRTEISWHGKASVDRLFSFLFLNLETGGVKRCVHFGDMGQLCF
jgi:hypothetical protein